LIPISPKRKREQGGFALLMVFVMAAILAVSLYMQLPRAAFESQRAKEELLQDRGKEYIRGIQLYVARNKKFPQTLDDLDKNTPQFHYIRKRYVDPMTGKDDWRIVHTNGVFLTDSLVQKPDQQQGQQTEQKAANTFITEAAAIGSTGTTQGSGATTIANRRRPSDNQVTAFAGGEGTAPNADPNAPPSGPVNQINPNYQGPNPLQPNANQQPSNPFGQPIQAGHPVVPGQAGQAAGQPLQPGQQVNQNQTGSMNFPSGGQPGQPFGNQPQGLGANPVSIGAGATTQGTNTSPGGVQTPGQPFNGPNPVAEQIMKQLTQPRGQAGLPGGQPGGQMGGGIAGIASKSESDSIKIYNEREKYNEWEFVYDMKKDPRMVGTQNQNQQKSGVGPDGKPLGVAPPGGLGEFGSGPTPPPTKK